MELQFCKAVMKEEIENIKTNPQETDNNSLSVVEARVSPQPRADG